MEAAIAGLLGVVIGGLITLTSERLRAKDERQKEQRSASQTLTEARREAYGRYLVAQQALHLSIKKEVEITRTAVKGKLELGHDSRARLTYDESSSAEMNVRLLCGENVRAALVTFETYVDKATRAAEGEENGQSLADNEWDMNRDDLIRKMYDELFPGLGQNCDK